MILTVSFNIIGTMTMGMLMASSEDDSSSHTGDDSPQSYALFSY